MYCELAEKNDCVQRFRALSIKIYKILMTARLSEHKIYKFCNFNVLLPETFHETFLSWTFIFQTFKHKMNFVLQQLTSTFLLWFWDFIGFVCHLHFSIASLCELSLNLEKANLNFFMLIILLQCWFQFCAKQSNTLFKQTEKGINISHILLQLYVLKPILCNKHLLLEAQFCLLGYKCISFNIIVLCTFCCLYLQF